MSELRLTDTNASDDSTGRAFGLEGNLYLPLAGSIFAGIAVFGGLLFAGIGVTIAALAGLSPISGAVVWALGFRHGKAPGYGRDWLDAKLGGGDFGPGFTTTTHTRSHASAPEGWFTKDMIVFGGLSRGGLVARGFRLEPPDLRGASVERLNAFQDQVRLLLSQLSAGRRLQVQWWTDADYRKSLLAYHERTQQIADQAVRRMRNERFTRYWQRILNGQLRREHLVIFYTIEVRANLDGRNEFEAVLNELAGQFEEFGAALRQVFGADTAVFALSDVEHFALIRRFLNPSLSQRCDDDPAKLFDPAQSLQQACWQSEAVAQANGGFYLDGHYHAVLTLSRWPQRTRPGMVVHLTGLPFLDYCVSVNVTPIAGKREIRKEEKAADRLRGEYAEKPQASLLVALRKKERKVEALAGGFARPFLVTYLIRVWAASPESLREKVAAIQAAVNAMDGAQVFECALPTSAKKLFFASWPGWTHSSYHHRELYAEDSYLADVLPFSATFTGDLEGAEALYDGSQGNLVGIATATNGSPQHSVLFGMTGAGKSAFVEDLLFQTADFFSHSLLIEEGQSYTGFAKAMGETPVVIHPDAALTLNYFDTQGLPLTQLHVATAVALLARMVGQPDNAELLALRQAQLSEYLQQLYRDTFTEWSRRNPQRAEEIGRFACGVQSWRQRLSTGTTPLEAFIDLRERIDAGEGEACAFLAAIPEAVVARFLHDPATQHLAAQTACAFYAAEDFPTHSALVELLAYARLPEHDKTEIERLATLLRAWCANGPYGRLFDGTTNVSFKRKVVLIELGLIPDQAVQMKIAAGLLISGLGRQHILSLPRAQRKRILFEELARFLDTPGGEQIVAEGYAQLRKHNCWCASIIQQYSRFKASRVRGSVIGNAKTFFFMRQSDRADLIDLATDLPLPESAVEAIQRYPLPEQLPADQRHSSICYFKPTAQPPQCGTVRHFKEEPCARAS